MNKFIFLLSITVFCQTVVADETAKNVMRLSFFDEFTTKKDIVMLGDSLIERGEWSEIFENKRIANRGVGGHSTADILTRLNQVVRLKPKSVFLMAGINDLIRTKGDFARTFLRYKEIINELQGEGRIIYVQSTLYVAPSKWAGLNPAIRALNDSLSQYCNNSNCVYIDLNMTMCPDGYLPDALTVDGVHLTGLGYRKWKNEIAQYIN